MADLTTTYMGLPLRNPLLVGASPLTANVETIQQIEAMGAGAIVTPSLFEEQIQLERFEFDETLHREETRSAEMITVAPQVQHGGPKEHLFWVKKAKEAIGIPVIASLNAMTKATWLEYAKRLEDTGVDGLECNLFASPHDGQQPAESVESEQLELIHDLTQAVRIPLSVKLSYFYTNPLNVVHRMDEAGAAAFVLFNRLFDPEIDIEQEHSALAFTLSHEADHRLPLRYAGLLAGGLQADICSSTGIFSGTDIIRMILAGATTVQTVSSLMRHGLEHIPVMLQQLTEWMASHGYDSLSAFRGKLSHRNTRDPWVYTRAQYIKLLMDPEGFMAQSSERID